MNKIIKAINEGVKQSLLQFNDDVQFGKTKNYKDISDYLQNYKIGDYVYYDDKLGHNDSIGEKVAICIKDDTEDKLFVMINHPLHTQSFLWADECTRLYHDKIADTKNGYENTLFILNNYFDDLDGTIWDQLKPNEYIPSKDELSYISVMCEINKDFANKIEYSPYRFYWSSSQKDWGSLNDYAFYSKKGIMHYDDKNYLKNAIVFLHLDI